MEQELLRFVGRPPGTFTALFAGVHAHSRRGGSEILVLHGLRDTNGRLLAGTATVIGISGAQVERGSRIRFRAHVRAMAGLNGEFRFELYVLGQLRAERSRSAEGAGHVEHGSAARSRPGLAG